MILLSDRTNDDIFIEEFSNMMAFRRNSGGASLERFQLPNIPVLDFPDLLKINKITYYAKVAGIEEPFFNALNTTMVEVLKERTYEQKLVLSNGTYRKDANGKFMTKTVSIDTDFVLVKSPVNINLSNYEHTANGAIKTNAKGEKVRYRASDGYMYVDMEKDIKGNIIYVYAIPKSCIFKANMTALVLSIHKRSNCYYGWRVAFANGVYMYLSVINFSRSQCDNSTRVLGIANKLDYSNEIKALFGLWKANNITFDNQITEVSYRMVHNNVPDNLGYVYFKGNLAEEDFQALQGQESEQYNTDSDNLSLEDSLNE